MEFILAYIDPGSGSLLIQALIAGIVVAPIFFRRQISRIMHRLRGQDPVAEMSPAPDDVAKGG